MRICIINNLYKPYDRGGAERVIELTVNKLINCHQVLILSTQSDDVKSCQVAGNLTICRYNPKNIYYLLNDYKMPFLKKICWHLFDLLNYQVARKIKGEIKRYNPEIVITHNLKGFSLQIPKIIRKLKIPHIHVLHDYQLIDPHGSLYRQGQNLAKIGSFFWLYTLITKNLINSPDLVISPSNFVLNKHLEYGLFKHSKTAVLPNPCSISSSKKQSYDFKKFERHDSLLKFLYLGQIEIHKGIEFLVRTFMKYDNPQSQLLIAGKGSQLLYIKELARRDERIKILGKIKREGLSDLFGQSDILIVPSLWWENLPTVIYEAYENQTPVLVSDSGGSKELVKENETGWIFKSGDEKNLLEKFNYLLSIKNQLLNYGQNGFEFIKQFSVDRYIERLLELCQDLKK